MFIKIWARLMACLFFLHSPLVFAKIIQDDVLLSGEEKYSYEKVCKTLTQRESPLIEYKTISSLDCMGQIVDVAKFCFKEMAHDPYYIRAVVDKEAKQVICKSAKKVQIKYECEGSNEYCEDSEIGCFKIKEKLAVRLKITQHSVLEKGKKRVLNCYFLPQSLLDLELKPNE